MLSKAIRKADDPEDPKSAAKAIEGITFSSPVGPVKVQRTRPTWRLSNFFVGSVRRDASLPDGIGVADVKAYNTADFTAQLRRHCTSAQTLKYRQYSWKFAGLRDLLWIEPRTLRLSLTVREGEVVSLLGT